jgi:hypothetical protein
MMTQYGSKHVALTFNLTYVNIFTSIVVSTVINILTVNGTKQDATHKE